MMRTVSPSAPAALNSRRMLSRRARVVTYSRGTSFEMYAWITTGRSGEIDLTSSVVAPVISLIRSRVTSLRTLDCWAM